MAASRRGHVWPRSLPLTFMLRLKAPGAMSTLDRLSCHALFTQPYLYFGLVWLLYVDQ